MTADIKALALRLAMRYGIAIYAQEGAPATPEDALRAHARLKFEAAVRAALAAGLRMGADTVEDNAWACHIESILHKALMSNADALRAKADELERQ